ncbi:MAG: LrgB family protein [Rhodospirillales bacterium]|jgi:predicted murein hydrolase (TIGR00659 family)
MSELRDIWVYLNASPLLHLTLTLLAFQFGSWIYRKGNLNPLLNPVLISVTIIVTILLVTKTDYQDYFSGAQFVHFLLGPATVALAIPLYRHFEKVRRSALAIAASIVTGSLTATLSAVGIGYFLNISGDALIALASKSVTAPVAMGISEQLGGLPSLTAVLVILTGIVGAMIGPMILNLIGVENWAARGLAIGTASHGIGTARALQVNEVAGAFSGIAMGLNALATAILLPLIWQFLF